MELAIDGAPVATAWIHKDGNCADRGLSDDGAEIERFERVSVGFDPASKPVADVLNETFVRLLRLESCRKGEPGFGFFKSLRPFSVESI